MKQGDKAERVTLGMGAGSAQIQANVDVHFKTPSEAVLVSQFKTDTTVSKGAGAGIPAAAGLDPAAVAAKSEITDRKKTLNAYASKSADATAKEIMKQMAQQVWIKVNDKGEVVP